MPASGACRSRPHDPLAWWIRTSRSCSVSAMRRSETRELARAGACTRSIVPKRCAERTIPATPVGELATSTRIAAHLPDPSHLLPLRRLREDPRCARRVRRLALAAVAFIGIDGRRATLARAGRGGVVARARARGASRRTGAAHPVAPPRDPRRRPPDRKPPGLRLARLRAHRRAPPGVALLPLLRDELRVRELRGRDVAVRLARASDGRRELAFDARVRADGSARTRALDVHRIALENVLIEYAPGAAPSVASSSPSSPGSPARMSRYGSRCAGTRTPRSLSPPAPPARRCRAWGGGPVAVRLPALLPRRGAERHAGR